MEHSEAVDGGALDGHGGEGGGDDDDDDLYESYGASEGEEAEADEMEAAAFEEAELWVGQELAWTADEFALTEQHSLPARYDIGFAGASSVGTPHTPRTPRDSRLFF